MCSAEGDCLAASAPHVVPSLPLQVTTLMKGAEDHLKMTIPTVEDIAAAEAALAEQQGVLAEVRRR